MAQERSSSRSTCSLDTAVVCAACFVGVGLKPLQLVSYPAAPPIREGTSGNY